MPDPGKNAHLTIKSMKMALGGDVWTGPTGSVTLYPTSDVKAAVGDKANVLWTLTQVEYDRITAGDTLTIGSNELEKLWVSGIQTQCNQQGSHDIQSNGKCQYICRHDLCWIDDYCCRF